MHSLDQAVVFACDRNYAPYAMFVAEQLARAHGDRVFDICIVSTDPLEVADGLVWTGLSCHRLVGGNPFTNEHFKTRHGSAACLHMLVHRQFHGRYRRIVTMDCDTFYCRGDVNQLFDLDLRGAAVAAVRDHQQWRNPGKRVTEFGVMGLASAPYFNTGLMVVDVDRYVEQGILERCIELQKSHPEALPRIDQSMLNIALHRAWTQLSPVWNWQYTWATRFFAESADPHILHFIGSNKPWSDPQNSLPRRFRAPYADFRKRHPVFDAQLFPADPDAPCATRGLRKAFLKHAWVEPAMRTYLERFADPSSTVPPRRG